MSIKRHDLKKGKSVSYNTWDRNGLMVIGYIIFLKLFISFLAMLGLRPCVQAFSRCGEEGVLFVVGLGLLIASLFLGHRLWALRLSGCDEQA